MEAHFNEQLPKMAWFLELSHDNVPIYNQNLDFPIDVNYYLGSLWQGEMGVV